MTAENTFQALKTGIPYTPRQMSRAIYRCLCEGQVREQCYGEDQEGNSVEIQWSESHSEWQIINHYANGQTSVNYDHFWEESFVNWDPAMLLAICENLDLTEELDEELAQQIQSPFPFPLTEDIRDAFQAHLDYISAGQTWLVRNDPEGQQEQRLIEDLQDAIRDAAQQHFGDDEDAEQEFEDEMELDESFSGRWYDELYHQLAQAELQDHA